MAENRIYKRKDGRYVVRWQTGNVRHQKYFHSRADARRFVANLDTSNEFADSEQIVLRDWADECISTYSANLSINTVIGYESMVRNHLQNNALGRMKLQDVRPFHVQRWIDGMNGLSPKSVYNLFGCLHWIFRKAVENRFIRENPTAGVILPQRIKPQRKVLTPQMANAILDAMEKQQHPDYSLWLFIASTGVRLSEALGIAESDINLKTGAYQIRQTVTVNPKIHSAVIQHRTKTGNAQRTGNAPQSILNDISATIKKNRQHKLIAGRLWNENNLVWCDDFGNPWRRNTIISRLRRIQQTMGIPESEIVGAHAFRHMVATMLLRSNVSEAAVAKQLGHYSANYTREQYMDAYQSDSEQIAEIMGNLLSK